mgnify:CR=1 FL=1
MLLSKTPLRMSWVGGGSDLPAFYKEEPGAVLSTAINKYVYIALNEKFDGKIRLNYSRTEEVDSVDNIEHPLFKQSLLLTKSDEGLEIASMADIPSGGSGLGSSSSFTVGLLNVLYKKKGINCSSQRLAEEACEIELIKCREPIGKQDQYAAAFGGINLIKFLPDDTVLVDPIKCSNQFQKIIEDYTLVFYTGKTRSASNILAQQSLDLRNNDKKNILRKMVKLVYDLKNEIENESVLNFGQILHENWKLKSQITSGITNFEIDEIYNIGKSNGAIGGKLLGAGNGGFMMFFAPPKTHSLIRQKLYNFKNVDFKIEKNGSQIVFNND